MRERNYGLAANVIDSVTQVVNAYGRVIVVEDDLVVAPYFLRFMNDALETYKDEERVGHIQACDFTHAPRHCGEAKPPPAPRVLACCKPGV